MHVQGQSREFVVLVELLVEERVSKTGFKRSEAGTTFEQHDIHTSMRQQHPQCDALVLLRRRPITLEDFDVSQLGTKSFQLITII